MTFGGGTTYKLGLMLGPDQLSLLPKLLDEFTEIQSPKETDSFGFIEPKFEPHIVDGRLQEMRLFWEWQEHWHIATPDDGPSIALQALKLALKWSTEPEYMVYASGVAIANHAGMDELLGYGSWDFYYDSDLADLIKQWSTKEVSP